MGIFDGGLNALGGLFGLGAGQGDYYKGAAINSKAKQQADAELAAANDTSTNKAIQDVAGGGSLSEALKGLTGQDQAAKLGALSTSPIAGHAVASQQVMNDPLTKQAFGEGGSLSNAYGQESNLANRGYSLQPEDYEAYGQASNNIARQFGGAENGLSQALASRGMGAAGSNPAAAQFSGMYGNKNEQLGQMQQQIAQQRMNTNMQRLNQTRSYIANMQGQADAAQNQAFNQNLAGQQSRQNNLIAQQGADTGQFSAQAGVDQASQNSKLANQKQGLGDLFTQGIGAAALSAPKMALGAALGQKSSDTTKNNAPNSATPTYEGE